MNQPAKSTETDWLPWLIALFSCGALVVSNGLTISGITALDEILLAEFGWDRSAYKLRETLTIMFAGIFAPLAGVFLDRYGVRKCMMVGWLTLLGCQLAYPLAGSLAAMYFLHALFAVVLVLCGLNAAVILTSNWFVDGRGRAIGLVLVGTSLGGAAITQFYTSALTAFSWQDSLRLGGVFPLAMLVLTWLWLRDTPATPPPAPANRDTGAAAADEGMSYTEALRTPSFWLLAVIAMSTFFTVLGVQTNMRLHLQDLGFTSQGATAVFSLFFFSAMIGKFLFGALSDYLSLRMVFNGNILVMLVGSVLLVPLDTALVYPAVVAFGFGWGGAYAMIQLSVVNIFGLRHAGKILGTITVLDAFGGAAGIYAVAAMQQSSGSYQSAFYLCTGLIAFALLCFTQVRFRSSAAAQTASASA